MIKTILTIHSGKPARQNRNNRKYTDPLEKKINKLIEKDLIDKWAFPYNLFNLSSLQKTGHKKPYLHAHWQPFSPTQWQTFSILSQKASTKSLPERHYCNLKKKRKPVIGLRADIPFDERHGMRFEATYNKNKIDIYNKEGKKLNGIISKTATVYAGYAHTQSVSESTCFRSGISRGYSTSKRNVLWEKGACLFKR
ncbi:hypothetical protein NEICINOT_04290 [Neisseria cinerea ATCC 14685]|uniref:Uncharacterized protein n=1 Tax=Neisseria cinerea ATCC 14685 TaxID=546262 RepID=D0W3P9_NEICI|nr:hypothetical protein NEICINOT_04290 [Neisseria cinerea ATCC 14685]